LYRIMEIILECVPIIEYKPLSKYGLTRFFLLSVISEMLSKDDICKESIKKPSVIVRGDMLSAFLGSIKEALISMIIDLNYEVKQRGDSFDYKGDLKSSVKVRELRGELLKSYEKDLAKGKTVPVYLSLI